MDEYAPNGRPRPAGPLTFEPLEDRSVPSPLASLLADLRPPPGSEPPWAALVARAPALLAHFEYIHSNPVLAAADAGEDAEHLAGVTQNALRVGPAASLLTLAERALVAAGGHERDEPSLSPDHSDRLAHGSPANRPAEVAGPIPPAANPPAPGPVATGPAQGPPPVPAVRSPEHEPDPVAEAAKADCHRRRAPVAPSVGPAPNAGAAARADRADDEPAPDRAGIAAPAEDAVSRADDIPVPLLGGVSVDVAAVERGAGELISLLGRLVEDCAGWLPAATNLACVAMSASAAAELARGWRRHKARTRDEPPPDPLLPFPEETA